MKTIIVATDFSDNSKNAINYAGSLAACSQAKIILFNAFQLTVHASNSLITPKGVDKLVELNAKKLKKIALETTEKYGVSVEITTKSSIVTEALEELVTQSKADLVVLGMHSNDWIDKVLGNTATALIRKAKYPILIVPENATFENINKIIFAHDPNVLLMPDNLCLIKDLAENFKAEVEILHVDTKKSRLLEEKLSVKKVNTIVEVALSEVDHYYKGIEEEHVAVGIDKEIGESHANLLVMVPHKCNSWRSFLNTSNTRTMALRTHIPLLILPSYILPGCN
ncbi:MAG: UspA protein [Segetibacter sp.]|nr:UspA protein [Segetibacter sp.]